jgi:hypothetical protein
MDNQEEIEKASRVQEEQIRKLSQCEINAFKGLGKDILLSFCDLFQYPDGECGVSATQEKINQGYYQSVEDFDSYHSSDIEFTDLYSGEWIDEYREITKRNLLKLGKQWRTRVTNEYPEAEIIIVVHEHENEWFLDTFNYRVNIENAIYL